MSIEIPNLWPSNQVKAGIVTPLAILRIRATRLREMTEGIVLGQVTSSSTEKTVEHHLDVIAPGLGNYRHRLVSITHQVGLPYPVTFSAPGILHPVAFADDDFITNLKEALSSQYVVSILNSLIAMSNEQDESTDGGLLVNS